MEEQEVIKLMLDSFNEDNRMMALQSGMSPDEVESYINQSMPSISFMLTNVYNKMKDANLLA